MDLSAWFTRRHALNTILITDSDVEDVLKLLNTSKASGPDPISPRLLKEGSDILSHQLARLFNTSLHTSYFPTVWKQANVVPVFKKGEKTNVSNYRSISLLSCIGKVFEKCVFKYLHNYIMTNKLISPVQSGFTPNDSAVFQLIKVCRQRRKTFLLLYCFFFFFLFFSFPLTAFCDFSAIFHRISLIFGQLVDYNL